jgi:hypothetical protein
MSAAGALNLSIAEGPLVRTSATVQRRLCSLSAAAISFAPGGASASRAT